MRGKLQEILNRFADIERQLMNPDLASNPAELVRLGKARAELVEITEAAQRYMKLSDELNDAQAMLGDPEMREMAEAEIPALKTELEALERTIKIMLVPRDPADDKPVIIEIRPAAGGDEAGLFASELFRMYVRYAERRKWRTEIIDEDTDGLGAIKAVTFKIDAPGAYAQLKYESGVHRVQRVPATESGGRTHTSTVTVAVLPEVETVDIEIKDDDLEVSTFRSSSAGGQHMQKNETAIRIIHKPSGIVATCQDERSQQQNRLKALSVIRAKLFQAEQDRIAQERGDIRRGQIGSGDRSEKIRTYNFNQSRITDHRIGKDVFNLSAYLDGDLQDMIDSLAQEEQIRKLAEGADES